MALRVTLKPSGNIKLTGGIKDTNFFATYRAVGYSCPTTCPLLNNGCYAQSGNVNIHQQGAYGDDDGAVFLRELERIPHGAILRLHVSGDVMKDGTKDGSTVVDVKYLSDMVAGAKARPDVTFYGYTHAWQMINREEYDFPANFVLNASCDDDEAIEEARAAGWDITTVIPSTVTDKRIGDMVVCPQQTSGMSCMECGLCFKSNRKLVVGFKAHGTRKRRVNERLELPQA